MLKTLALWAWAAALAHGVSGSPPSSVSIKPRLGDRFFVESVLLDVFGPAARETAMKYVVTSASLFGGPCDIYEQVRVGQAPHDFAEPRGACPGGKGSASLPMIGTPNVLRQGYVTRACEALTSTAATMDFALKRIFPNGALEPPAEKTLVAVFQLFNMERVPSREVVQKLEGLAAAGSDLKKRWSAIYLTLCVDPGWQLI